MELVSKCISPSPCANKSGIPNVTRSGRIEWKRDNRLYMFDSRLGEARQEPEIRITCTVYYHLSKAGYGFLPVGIREGCLYRMMVGLTCQKWRLQIHLDLINQRKLDVEIF